MLKHLLPCLLLTVPAYALDIVTPEKKVSFTLQELKKKLPVKTVTIKDPVYKKEKTYNGFPLSDFLKLIGHSEADEAIFKTQDGYSPHIALEAAMSHPAILAFEEKNNPRGWEPLKHGKEWITPAPIYLVWQNQADMDNESFPKPYQLIEIELVHFMKKYDKIFPKELNSRDREKRGFTTFKDQCFRCHSINLQGGQVGPELNVPKNITEYWNKDVLKKFIHNVPEFRAQSKMPPFSHLSEEEIGDIVSYLEFMKDHKIKSR